MHHFARLRAEKLPGWKVEVAFLAMAQPLLAAQLASTAYRGHRQVVVQPHLLFDGELVQSIAEEIAAMVQSHPKTQWLLTPPLADPPDKLTNATKLIEKVILDRCNEAGIHVVGLKADD
jgi:sirohydrochlorin ferrochelatase